MLDEPTAALDVSVQALVLKLLDTLRRQEGLAFVFVSRDLDVVRMLCERVVVPRNGIWRNGRKRAVKRFVEIVHDKPINEITSDDDITPSLQGPVRYGGFDTVEKTVEKSVLQNIKRTKFLRIGMAGVKLSQIDPPRFASGTW